MKKYLLIFCFFLMACSSDPKVNEPEWTHAPTRNVDNGYIVYVGTAEDMKQETAQFKAEGMALEDLANECSFIPKGTRLENRFSEKPKYATTAFVQVAVEFQDCEKAKHAIEPSEIKSVANASFTQQLRRYQDLTETGVLTEASDAGQVEPLQEIPPAPEASGYRNESVHFYAVRQYVAYQKEVVILSPPAAYPPAAPQTTAFVEAMRPASTQLQTFEAQNPSLKTQGQAWSKLQDKPNISRPGALTKNLSARTGSKPQGLKPPAAVQKKYQGNSHPGPRGKSNPANNPRGKRKKGNNPEEAPAL